jgi:hypothetical protein
MVSKQEIKRVNVEPFANGKIQMSKDGGLFDNFYLNR